MTLFSTQDDSSKKLLCRSISGVAPSEDSPPGWVTMSIRRKKNWKNKIIFSSASSGLRNCYKLIDRVYGAQAKWAMYTTTSRSYLTCCSNDEHFQRGPWYSSRFFAVWQNRIEAQLNFDVSTNFEIFLKRLRIFFAKILCKLHSINRLIQRCSRDRFVAQSPHRKRYHKILLHKSNSYSGHDHLTCVRGHFVLLTSTTKHTQIVG